MKAILHLIYGFIILTILSCENKDLDDYEEGYFTGTFLGYKLVNGHFSADTVRGFCILLKNSEHSKDSNSPMDLYTFSLPDNSFTFPSEIYKYRYNGSTCGPKFFPDSIISKYKIMLKYRNSTEDEIIDFACGFCTLGDPTFMWQFYEQVIIEEIKISLP